MAFSTSTIVTKPESPPPKDTPSDLESQDPPRSQQPSETDMTASSCQSHTVPSSRWRRFLASLTPEEGEVYHPDTERSGKPKWYRRLLDAGFEENGIKPVPIEERTSTQYSNLFTVFFTCLMCLLPYVPPPILKAMSWAVSRTNGMPIGLSSLTGSDFSVYLVLVGSQPACWRPSAWV